jgi:4-hydroxybutyryl-CoA dehydratase/vinylacetyl-CoA-Delta-isomerase
MKLLRSIKTASGSGRTGLCKGQLLDSREVIDHPFIRGHATRLHDLCSGGNREYADLMTTTSHLTGHKINRFTHINIPW